MATALITLAAAAVLASQPRSGYSVEHVAPEVWLVRDDAGQWGGPSMGTSHQVNPKYQVRKLIDLSGVPQDVWKKLTAARLRVFFAMQDYSWALHDIPYDGLDEAFEVVVNGHVHRHPTAGGFGARSRAAEPLRWRWTDFPVALSELKRGVNEIIIRKATQPAKKRYDDYIYVGIDNTVSHGHSAVSFDGGKTWTSEKLNTIGARGEYMVRMVLIAGNLSGSVRWTPAPARGASPGGEYKGPGRLRDPLGVVGFVETSGRIGAGAVALGGGAEAVLWFDSRLMDPLVPPAARVQFSGAAPAVKWLDDNGEVIASRLRMHSGGAISQVTAPRAVPRRLVVSGGDGPCTVQAIDVRFGRNYLPPPAIDMCPPIAHAPPRQPAPAKPHYECHGNRITVGDGLLQAEFTMIPYLSLTRLQCGYSPRPLIADGEDTSQLFMIEVGGKRYAENDFFLQGLTLSAGGELKADLAIWHPRIFAVLSCRAEGDGALRVGLELSNRSDETLKVKALFPLLVGIDADYYLYPYAGGIIADVPTYLRVAYGENLAWWQMLDVFRPAEGFGLMVRADDPAAGFKCPVLRKGRTYDGRYSITQAGRYMDPELLWRDSLPQADGISVGFEYLRRTLRPGQRLRLPDAVVKVHRGDFHRAMELYAAWARRTWHYRPYPGPLADRWNITPAGWGQSPLVNKKGWRTDYLTEAADVVEMMSWWEWSDLGPWRVPMNHKALREKLGEALYNRYRAYWVMDPIAGRLRYPLNRGDYRYNETWGGLAAFKAHIRRVRKRGIMPGVYIDGILACDTTDVGHKYGPKYGVINPYWRDYYKCPLDPKGYVAAYASWNMCCDTEWWADYLSRTIARIFRDTGVDYLRIDEFGHAGYPCYSTKHTHMFAPEPGHNGWLQGCAEICRRAHRLMDKIRPGLALTTEFPGNDHMIAYLDGAITHEVSYRRPPIRPVPCDLLRFYLPSCKPMDLDYKHVPDGLDLKLWNAMASFGYRYRLRYLRLLREHTDAFGRGRPEALVPTLRRLVYANRFSSPDKVITAVFNARPYPVAGPLVAASAGKGYRYVELLSGRELHPVPAPAGRGLAVGLKLGPSKVALIARLRQLIGGARGGPSGLKVGLVRPLAGWRVVVTDLDNAPLLSQPVQGREVAMGGRRWKDARGRAPLLVKLCRGNIVEDVVRWQPRGTARGARSDAAPR